MIEQIQPHNEIVEAGAMIQQEVLSPQTQPFESLNLTEEQLFSRIESLKDFQTYEKTKVRRIHLKDTQQMRKSPILDMVDRLGKKRNENKVLAQYTDSSVQETKSYKHERKQSRQVEQKSEEKEPKLTPIFINFKLKEKKQLGKVAKLLKHTTQQKFMPLISRYNSQSKTMPVQDNEFCIPMPKELLKLKKSLKLHPAIKIKRRLTVDAAKYESGGESTQKLDSNSNKRVNQRLHLRVEKQQNHQFKKAGSQLYLQSIRPSSLEECESTKQISLHDVTSKTPGKKLDQNLTTKSKLNIKINQIINQKTHENNRKIARWPSYSQYDCTEDQAKVQKIILNFKRQNEKNLDLDENHCRLQQKIEEQFSKQQTELDEGSLEESDILGPRFTHYLKLEKQAYQKNLKDLQRYRKFVKIESQRHEIWANGIKRLKKY